MAEQLTDRVKFDLIRYANCWEDANILCAALNPAPGKRFLSIASGGDNSFALAAEGADVVAADLSFSQLACVELKIAAIKTLSHAELLAFIGIRDCIDRSQVYRALRPLLRQRVVDYWDGRLDILKEGIVHAGKFERYFQLFRSYILPLTQGRKNVARLLTPKSLEERRHFYTTKWDNLRWRLMFKIFVSRFVMGRLGRDPEFFRYVEGSVADRIMGRVKYALTELPSHTNPYLEYILTGNYGKALPRYLEPERYGQLREGLDRVTLFEGSIQDAAVAHAKSGFDGFNLSDIFEYLDPALCQSVYSTLLKKANVGARFAYWNMLVPRSCPESITTVVSHREISDELFRRDQAFFYSAFVVEVYRGKKDR